MPFSCPSVGPFHALSVGSTLGPLCGKERAPMQGRTQRSSLHVCHLRRSHYQTSPEISRLDLVCHLYSPCIACTSQPMFLDGARPFASPSLARRAEVLLRPEISYGFYRVHSDHEIRLLCFVCFPRCSLRRALQSSFVSVSMRKSPEYVKSSDGIRIGRMRTPLWSNVTSKWCPNVPSPT